MGCIYKATCNTTGKSYIGKTRYELKVRKNAHLIGKDNCLFHKALRKYGRDDFEWEEIYHSDDEDSLYKKEKLFIRIYGTMMPYGYNMTTGGDGQYSREFGEDWKKANMQRALDLAKQVYCVELDKVFLSLADVYRETHIYAQTVRKECADFKRKARLYHFCWNTSEEIEQLKALYKNGELLYGKPLTEENRKNISKAQKKRMENPEQRNRLANHNRGRPSWNKGGTQRPEWIAASRASWYANGNLEKSSGANNKQARPIINLTDGNIFDWMGGAIEFYGLPKMAFTNIGSCCRGKLKTAYGFKWAYYTGDTPEQKLCQES